MIKLILIFYGLVILIVFILSVSTRYVFPSTVRDIRDEYFWLEPGLLFCWSIYLVLIFFNPILYLYKLILWATRNKR